MHLIQVFLPLYDNQQRPIDAIEFHAVRQELVDRFGGLTGYTRTPIEGLWKDDAQHTARDEMVIFEVISDAVDAEWWAEYRRDLERRFRQQQILIRAQSIEIL